MEPVHPVLALIKRRNDARDKPGQRNDSFKLGLAIEGGAMRGVVTAGMVTGLEMLGLKDVFDSVYGSSNGAYFIAGQARYGMTIYYDHINNRKFTNLLRMLWGQPVVDLQFLCDIVMTEEVVLDCEAVVNSSVPLKVLASSVERGEIEVLDQFQSGLDLLNALHASARMPWAAGGHPLEYCGQSYWDSGIVDPFAIKSALAGREDWHEDA